jgi:cysteine desulfuration protein SufE
VKGLVALLLKIYSGQKQETIEQIDIESLFTELGLKQYLSPSRSNGFFSMVQRIQQLAAQ